MGVRPTAARRCVADRGRFYALRLELEMDAVAGLAFYGVEGCVESDFAALVGE